MSLGALVALFAGALILFGCGAETTRPATAGHVQQAARTFAVGRPVSPRPVSVMGIPGTMELRVEDPALAGSPSVFVSLGRSVPREPRDVCFGTYVAGESPADGDIGCQVRGSQPLVLTLGDDYIPHSDPVARFITMWGQVKANVNRVTLIGPGGTHMSLPLSTHRLFLVAFSRSARGTVRLVAQLADGHVFTHAFTLPLTNREAGAWPRLRRRGAVFNDGVGENIVTKSYRQIIREYGPPLKSFTTRHRTRCIYYDIVGYSTGWTFCFRGQAMVAAAGNQQPPARAH
jgi:hypothetical protein